MTEDPLDAPMLAAIERLLSQVSSETDRYCINCDMDTTQMFVSRQTQHESGREISFMWRCDRCATEVHVANFKLDG
jgi:hypothetical protein